MATRRRLGTGPAPATQAVPGQVPRLLAAERATAPRSSEDGADRLPSPRRGPPPGADASGSAAPATTSDLRGRTAIGLRMNGVHPIE